MENTNEKIEWEKDWEYLDVIKSDTIPIIG